MPSMENLYQKFKGNSFEILTISIDTEGKQIVVPYMKKFDLTFPALLDPKSKVAKLYRTTGVPETFIINKEGFIVHKAIGPRTWDTEESLNAFNNLVHL
jgi:peroxiredoxin